jgi:hypothetical protein
MTISFQCSECGQQFQTEDMYGGRRWRCPKCSAGLTIPPADDIPVQMVMDSPGPRRRRRRSDADDANDRERDGLVGLSSAWETVRTGLRLLASAVTILLIAFVLWIGAVLVLVLGFAGGGANAGGGRFVGDVAGAVGLALLLACLACLVLWITGQAMCCAVPRDSEAKGLAVASLVCVVGATLLGLLGALLLWTASRGPFGGPNDSAVGPLTLIGLAALVGTVGHFLLVFALRAVALYFHRESLAANWLVFFVVDLAYIAGNIVFQLVAHPFRAMAGPGPVPGSVMVALVLLVLSLALLAWLLSLLSATRAAIPRPEPEREWYDDT